MPRIIGKSSFRRAVGLRQIAEELNVSVSLVSKVLTGRMGTSSATPSMVRAIRKTAAELNYRKNLTAEALRTGRQNVIAVCIHRHGAPGSGIVEDMMQGIAEQAALVHQRLLVQYYLTANEFRAFAPDLHGNSVDGVIMGGLGHPELVADLKAMCRHGLPVVTIHDQDAEPAFVNVGMDQVEVGRRATAHLIAQGCRRIAHFGLHGVYAGSRSVFQGRYDGYCKALAEAGLAQRVELVIQVSAGLEYAAAWDAARQLLDRGIPFDGIVGQSDNQLAAALNMLIGRGWKVPQQAKLIGVDNAPFCPFTIVPLSSVSQEYVARGRLAVRLLMDQLKHVPVASVQVEPRIYARASSVLPAPAGVTNESPVSRPHFCPNFEI